MASCKAKRPKLKEPLAIAGILQGVLKGKGILKKVTQYSVFEAWEGLVGPTIAKRATPKKMQGETLVVQAVSSAWAQELSFMKAAILKKIKEELPDAAINDIRFTAI
jgi:predicted nucleic acid-binding Zn ribbon protein